MQSSNGKEWIMPKIGANVRITMNDDRVFEGQCNSFSMSANPIDCVINLENVRSNFPGTSSEIVVETSKIRDLESTMNGANIMPKIDTQVRVSLNDGSLFEGICKSFSMSTEPMDCMLGLKNVCSSAGTFREKGFFKADIQCMDVLSIGTTPAVESISESSQTTWSCRPEHLCDLHEKWSEETLKKELDTSADLLGQMYDSDSMETSSFKARLYAKLGSKEVPYKGSVIEHENMFVVDCISVIFHNLMYFNGRCPKKSTTMKETIKNMIRLKHGEMMYKKRQQAAEQEVFKQQEIHEWLQECNTKFSLKIE